MAPKGRTQEIPAFAPVDEEFEFWETDEPEEFEDGPADELILAIKSRCKVAATLRLDDGLLAEIRRIAREENVPYQTLTRTPIVQGVSPLQRARASRS